MVLAVFILERPFKGKDEENGEIFIFQDLKPKEAAKIEIKDKDQEVVLVRTGDTWFIGSEDGYKADGNEIDYILRSIKEFNRKNLVSLNPKKQHIFQVNEDDGVEINVCDAQERSLAHFFLGKTDPNLFGTYLRRVDEDMVYLVEGYLRTSFIRGPEDWRDRTIFDFDPNYISQIILESEGREIVAQKEDSGEWSLIRPEELPADRHKLDNMAHTLARLKTSGFAKEGEPKDYDWDNPEIKVTVTLKDKEEKILLIGGKRSKEENDFYVKKKGEDTIFVLPRYVIDNLNRKLADLKAQEKGNNQQ